MNTDMRLRRLLIGFLLLACTKPQEDALVSVSFRLCSQETKVTGATYADESAVTCWSVFVIDSSTGWFRHGSSADSAPVVLPLKAGRPYRCLALVNYPRADLISAEDPAGTVVSLADNAPGRLLMFGERTLMPVAGMSEVPLSVRRLVVKLTIRGISVDFSSCPEWAGKTLHLRHIYVTNACLYSTYGEDPFSVSPARSAWYNTLGWHGGGSVSAALDALLADRDLDVALDEVHPYSDAHTFYFYPNPTDVDSFRTDTWSPRHTRLVLEAAVDGETYYYPIDIPALGRNSVCSATDIVIHGPGWKHPEGGTVADATVEVNWNTASAITLD